MEFIVKYRESTDEPKRKNRFTGRVIKRRHQKICKICRLPIDFISNQSQEYHKQCVPKQHRFKPIITNKQMIQFRDTIGLYSLHVETINYVQNNIEVSSFFQFTV